MTNQNPLQLSEVEAILQQYNFELATESPIQPIIKDQYRYISAPDFTIVPEKETTHYTNEIWGIKKGGKKEANLTKFTKEQLEDWCTSPV